jgi:propionyl-CoA carboxylase alpha chain
MKYLVNGREWEPDPGADAEVARLSDRLVVRTKEGSFTALSVRAGGATYVSYRGRSYKIERAGRKRGAGVTTANGEARAPMPGQIVEVTTAVGSVVEAGERLMVLEAMKMQQPIVAPTSGTVTSLGVAKGDQVAEGQVLAVVT